MQTRPSMQLLVSVADASEAAAALAGGADIIDAKDPTIGPLGPVTIDIFRQIGAASTGAQLLTAALGDVDDEAAVERAARDSACAGAGLVKIGFAGVSSVERTASLIGAAVRGASAAGEQCGVIAVAYADRSHSLPVSPDDIVHVAKAEGAAGVLLDTANKSGPGLRALYAQSDLTAWVERAHEAGLLVALAGRLQIDDLLFVRAVGADVAGVRGAACEGGRTGRVTTEKVRALRERCRKTG